MPDDYIAPLLIPVLPFKVKIMGTAVVTNPEQPKEPADGAPSQP
jgi:hypothetical protein